MVKIGGTSALPVVRQAFFVEKIGETSALPVGRAGVFLFLELGSPRGVFVVEGVGLAFEASFGSVFVDEGKDVEAVQVAEGESRFVAAFFGQFPQQDRLPGGRFDRDVKGDLFIVPVGDSQDGNGPDLLFDWKARVELDRYNRSKVPEAVGGALADDAPMAVDEDHPRSLDVLDAALAAHAKLDGECDGVSRGSRVGARRIGQAEQEGQRQDEDVF